VDDSGDGGGGLTAPRRFCGSCGAPSSPTAKFCGGCGTRLTQATQWAEYKQVTVLFADVVHSMDIAAALALQAISVIGAVISGGDTPPPARIVLFSDGKETMPANPNNPKGAITAARTAKDQGVPISTISFGTPNAHSAHRTDTSTSTVNANRYPSTTRR
jgi:hypothetical protein